jgi:hypothetical protein
LSDCFTNTPDYDGYQVAKEDPRPSVEMDDPAEVVR